MGEIRSITLGGTPAQMGMQHGTSFAADIHRYTNERIDLVTSGLWSGTRLSRGEVIDIAEGCLEHHRSFAPHLTDEMEAIGAGAGVSAAEMIIVGGFTDFVDVVRAATGGPMPPEVVEDDCTAILVPDHRTRHGGYLAQTWDMHDTAAEFVVLTHLEPADRPRTTLFTTTGCLGQIGINELGVAVGINNLMGADARPGVTWPFVVRHALEQSSAEAARDVILDTPLAGAHNYLVLDAGGTGFNIEAFTTVAAVTELEDDPLVHTNHALHPETQTVETMRPAPLQDSSERRLRRAVELLSGGNVDEQRLMAVTRDEEAICQVAEDPYRIESCGAAIMRPATIDLWAVQGLPTKNDYEHVSVVGTRA